MPAYFYHVDHGHLDLDEEGTELRDVADARHQAIDVLANILRNGAGAAVLEGTPLTLWVTDGPGGTGHRLFSLRVSADPPS
jgi:hypothetical protein